MDKFEYEDTRAASESAPSYLIVLSLVGCLVALALWTCAGAVLVKAGVRNTPVFAVNEPEFEAKLLSYLAQPKTPDHVFVGSSRIYRHIDPIIVEDAMAEAGCPDADVYNFGIGGLSSSNVVFELEWLTSRSEMPDNVWIEASSVDQWSTARSRRNLDFAPVWGHPLWRERLLEDAEAELGSAWEAELEVLKLSLQAFFNVGLLSDRFSTLQDVAFDRDLAAYSAYAGLQGHASLSTTLLDEDPRRRQQLDEQIEERGPKFMRRSFNIHSRRFRGMSAAEREDYVLGFVGIYIEQLPDRLLDRAGFVFPPRMTGTQLPAMTLERDGRSFPVLTSPIQKVPEIGEIENWIDVGHMTKAGAAAYSRHIGRTLCEMDR